MIGASSNLNRISISFYFCWKRKKTSFTCSSETKNKVSQQKTSLPKTGFWKKNQKTFLHTFCLFLFKLCKRSGRLGKSFHIIWPPRIHKDCFVFNKSFFATKAKPTEHKIIFFCIDSGHLMVQNSHIHPKILRNLSLNVEASINFAHVPRYLDCE